MRPPDVLETHTSVLFFVGERVVKVRKPMDFGFADFTDLSERRRVCRREVRLNRRLSADVYLGAASVQMGGRALEHAVVMRRLPAERSLASLLAAAEDLVPQLDRIAATLARFHAGAARSPRIASQGTARPSGGAGAPRRPSSIASSVTRSRRPRMPRPPSSPASS